VSETRHPTLRVHLYERKNLHGKGSRWAWEVFQGVELVARGPQSARSTFAGACAEAENIVTAVNDVRARHGAYDKNGYGKILTLPMPAKTPRRR